MGLVVVKTLFNAHVNGDADCDDTHSSVAILERTGGDGSGSAAAAVCRAGERGSCDPSDG